MASSGKAWVQKPAPHFRGTAVVDGAFEGTRSSSLSNHVRLDQELTKPRRDIAHNLHIHQEMADTCLRTYGLDVCLSYGNSSI